MRQSRDSNSRKRRHCLPLENNDRNSSDVIKPGSSSISDHLTSTDINSDSVLTTIGKNSSINRKSVATNSTSSFPRKYDTSYVPLRHSVVDFCEKRKQNSGLYSNVFQSPSNFRIPKKDKPRSLEKEDKDESREGSGSQIGSRARGSKSELMGAVGMEMKNDCQIDYEEGEKRQESSELDQT